MCLPMPKGGRPNRRLDSVFRLQDDVAQADSQGSKWPKSGAAGDAWLVLDVEPDKA
jgi:hypothetical protein